LKYTLKATLTITAAVALSLVGGTLAGATNIATANPSSSQIDELVRSANFLLDTETSYLPGTSLSSVLTGGKNYSTGTKFKDNSLGEVKKRVALTDTDWYGISANKNYTGNWCAWTASFMLRNSKIFPSTPSKKVVISSSSELVRKALLTGGKKVFGPAASISGFTVQPGDLIAYYHVDSGEDFENGKTISKVRLIELVNSLITNPGKYVGPTNVQNRPFDHTGVVVKGTATLEGNRGFPKGVLKVFKKPDVSGFDGLVVIRPSW
jgi:hypothetical protein